MSVALCDGIIDIFEAIIPCKILPGKLISVKKPVHLITAALHPHCKQNLMKDIGEAHFVLNTMKLPTATGKKSCKLECTFGPLCAQCIHKRSPETWQ